MTTNEVALLRKDVEYLKGEVDRLKFIIDDDDDEGELTDWAKKELEEARKVPLSECVSHEEVKKMLAEKWATK